MSAPDLDEALAALRAGELVAFPTETVYGLGADASNSGAVDKIYAAKGRPRNHPLIVHLARVTQVREWAADVPAAAHALAARFWPGPLTLILQRAPHVSDRVTGGQPTVGLRVPSHPVAQALLTAFGGGIAAPSANRYGRVSATTAAHVRSEFGPAVGCVLDGGASTVGIESTIVDLSGDTPALLRPGHITAREIEAVLGRPLAAQGAASPRAPGTLARHYAPQTPLQVMPSGPMLALAAAMIRQGHRVAVLACSARRPPIDGLTWVASSGDAAVYAHDLYANLRALDESGCSLILVEQPPYGPEWSAVHDRLMRAAAGSAAPDPP